MEKPKQEDKRLNRVSGLDEAIGKAIDPIFRKRGFASREIVARWADIAPKPYDKVAMPDKLHWPRGEAGAEGAILFLRCAESQRMALAHEGHAIAAAVNRYFGYVLVGSVKLSASPFTSSSGAKPQAMPELDAAARRSLDQNLAGVEDENLKQALEVLGAGILRKKSSRSP